MFATKKLFATALAVLTLGTVAIGSPLTPVGEASAATSIQGTVTYNGSRVAGAQISVLRHNGSYWVRTGVTATTTSTGT